MGSRTIALFAVLACLAACTPQAPPSKPVVLPKSIDPIGRTLDLPTGTQVFVNRSTVIRYRTIVNGKAIDQATLVTGFVSLSHGDGDVTVVTSDGRHLIFPASAKVARDQAASMIFVKPSETMPPSLVGRKPDYVVP